MKIIKCHTANIFCIFNSLFWAPLLIFELTTLLLAAASMRSYVHCKLMKIPVVFV